MGLICRRGDASAARFVFARVSKMPADETRVNALVFEALEASGIELDESAGVCFTVSKGTFPAMSQSSDGTVFEFTPDFLAVALARKFRTRGPSAAAVAACASGLASVKLGADWIRDGACSTVLAGAAESSCSEFVLNSFRRLGVLSASGVTRPFDARRDGFVVGEGAAIFKLEKSGAPNALGHVLSVALGAEGHHLTTPEASGAAIADVIERALREAGYSTSAAPSPYPLPQGGRGNNGEIGWVHAHGTATGYNDRVEAAALRRVFGIKIPPVTATKGATGHLLGASGAVALGITLESLRDGVIPCVCGTEEVAEEFRDLDLVLEQRKTGARTALILNHGFGGHIAAAVVSV